MDINQYRALLGISQEQAAAELECDPSLMSRWCNGKLDPGRYWWTRIQAWSRGAITANVPRQTVTNGGRR